MCPTIWLPAFRKVRPPIFGLGGGCWNTFFQKEQVAEEPPTVAAVYPGMFRMWGSRCAGALLLLLLPESTQGRLKGLPCKQLLHRYLGVSKNPSENHCDYSVDAQVCLTPPAIKKTTESLSKNNVLQYKTIDLPCKTIYLRSKTIDSLSESNSLLSTIHQLPYETIDLANETTDLLSVFKIHLFLLISHSKSIVLLSKIDDFAL